MENKTQKKLLLTDEEMDEAYCLADLHKDKMGHKAIAQAQLSKLLEAGYVQLDEDQTLPPLHQDPFQYNDDAVTASIETQVAMLKAGFRKIRSIIGEKG